MKAEYQAMIGDRRLNAMMKAGTHCIGVFAAHRWIITFGRQITQDEAEKLCEPFREMLNTLKNVECKEVTFLGFLV